MENWLQQYEKGVGLAPVEAEAETLLAHSEACAAHGLVLTRQQAQMVAAERRRALGDAGRVEFGEGAVPKLMAAFCDSPYVDAGSYATFLAEITGVFYQYKNETRERLSDEEVMEYLKTSFDGWAQGSLELLRGRALEILLNRLAGAPDGEERDDMRTGMEWLLGEDDVDAT